jgi:glucokinase
MTKSFEYALLADIGATYARFTISKKGSLGPIATFRVVEFQNFLSALHAFYRETPSEHPVHRAMIAVAGPVKDGRATLTNVDWVVDAEEIQREFGLKTNLVNDFAAVACSIPSLTAQGDVEPIGSGAADSGAPIAVLGPGTGLGVACLISSSEKFSVIASEGGHATLAGTSEREDAIIKNLRARFGHVSAERAVSGAGLENLFNAIAAIEAMQVLPLSAAEITKNALTGECRVCRDALKTFCAFLGSFAGNVALTFRATGGVYIAGGISPRIVEFIRNSEFRQRFEAKGRFSQYLQPIPSFVITHPAAAFLGLLSLIEQPS